MRPHFEIEAREELREAVDYSDEKFGMGNDFIDAIEDALGKIASSPQRFKIFGKKCRIFRLKNLPYYLVYRHSPETESITVYAVAHTSRAPGYWLSRLPE
jgi:mRNA-degrading endonuclease RelE of RelBE toxin-antitoxin system